MTTSFVAAGLSCAALPAEEPCYTIRQCWRRCPNTAEPRPPIRPMPGPMRQEEAGHPIWDNQLRREHGGRPVNFHHLLLEAEIREIRTPACGRESDRIVSRRLRLIPCSGSNCPNTPTQPAQPSSCASREGRMCSARPLSELSRFRDRRLRSRRPRDAICSNDLRRPSSLSRLSAGELRSRAAGHDSCGAPVAIAEADDRVEVTIGAAEDSDPAPWRSGGSHGGRTIHGQPAR